MTLPDPDEVKRELDALAGPGPASSSITITVHSRADVVAALAQAKTFRSELEARADALSPTEREYMRDYAIEAYANASAWNKSHDPDEQVVL